MVAGKHAEAAVLARLAMKVADHVVDMGPGAGSSGGEVVFEGSYADLRRADTLTGRYLDRTLPIKEQVRTPSGWLPIRNARENNLKGVDVDIPTGVFTVGAATQHPLRG